MIYTNKIVYQESYNRWFVGLRARKNELKKKKCVCKYSFHTAFHLMQNPETWPKKLLNWTVRAEPIFYICWVHFNNNLQLSHLVPSL